MSTSDEALLAGLAAGDRDASAEFVRRFQRRAFGLARTIVDDSATAEDVAQQAFVRAWRYAGSYDARRGSVVTWLLAIVRNVAVDQLRLRRAEPMDPELLASKLQLAHDRPARDEHAAVDERDELRRALTTLPASQRRALLLASYYGRTAAEIAELEAIPLGTAKTRIRAAMIRLREALEVNGER